MFYGILGLFPEVLIAIIADRVGDRDKGEFRHSGHAGHGLSGLPEPIRDDGRRGKTGLPRQDGIVQTARGATPSISDGRDDGLASLHLFDDLGRHRPAGIRFFKTDDVASAVSGSQDGIHMVEQVTDFDLSVIQQADGGAFNRCQSRYEAV